MAPAIEERPPAPAEGSGPDPEWRPPLAPRRARTAGAASPPVGGGRARVGARRRRRLAAFVGYAAWRLDANIERVDVSQGIGTDRPDAGNTEAVNVLLIGSDTREGAGNDGYGDNDGTLGEAHSDTNLLVHLSADRSSATVVSIPRDSMTSAPPRCSPTAPQDEWVTRQWNQNYRIGGHGLPHPHPRGQHRAVHRPLRRRRLPGVQADGRRPGRRRGLHVRADRRPQHAPAARRRPAHPGRAAGPAVRPRPQVGR